MKALTSIILVLSWNIPTTVLALETSSLNKQEADFSQQSLLISQRNGGGGGNRGGGGRPANRPSGGGGNRGGGGRPANRPSGGGNFNLNTERNGSNRVNRPVARPGGGGNQAINRPGGGGNFNLNGDRNGSNRVARPNINNPANRDKVNNFTNNPANRDKVNNFTNNPANRDKVNNFVNNSNNRNFNLNNDRNFSNRVNRNNIGNTFNRNNVVINNPRGWNSWGWHGGSPWYPSNNYWGGGFWGPFAVGTVTGLVTGAAINAANQPKYVVVQSGTPGYTLLSNYGLTQTQCGNNVVIINGPSNSVICAFPNATIPVGTYNIDESTLTLIPQY